MIQIREEAMLLTAKSKAYDMDGNKGTSHRVRVLIGGDIFPLKATAEQVEHYVELENEKGEVVIALTSVKENPVFTFVSFERS